MHQVVWFQWLKEMQENQKMNMFDCVYRYLKGIYYIDIWGLTILDIHHLYSGRLKHCVQSASDKFVVKAKPKR